MKMRYVGSAGALEVPGVGIVERGNVYEVDDALATKLKAQYPSHWAPVDRPPKKSEDRPNTPKRHGVAYGETEPKGQG